MTKLKLLLGVGVVLVACVAVSAALAAPGKKATTCAGGTIDPGTYRGLTVTGTCVFSGGTVTIDGNLVVADGAALNPHDATTADVTVTGNVLVGKGAVLGLGSFEVPQQTTVEGNIVAHQPLTMYLASITVRGNVISTGGGWGPTADNSKNFPIKDNKIGGNLIVQGWQGGWFGALRNNVSGNMIVNHNVGLVLGEESGLPDSTEVSANTVGGNLICQGNQPMAQIGDAAPVLNTVAGHKIGQCAGL